MSKLQKFGLYLLGGIIAISVIIRLITHFAIKLIIPLIIIGLIYLGFLWIKRKFKEKRNK